MTAGQISEESFCCGVCFELLVDPTTLTCGHSICRYCLARWWVMSKKSTCPECRQEWKGFPKVNVLLRNNISMLFPDQIKERQALLKTNSSYNETLQKFEGYGRESEPRRLQNLNWSLICVIVAITIAVAVILGVGIKKFHGLTKQDLMSKSLRDWSPEDVGLWIGSFGPWSKGVYDQRFVDAGIDGVLLLKLDDTDLIEPPLGISLSVKRRFILESVKQLKVALSHHPSGFWEYKKLKSGMAMFIMFGLREFPRSTLLYLYLFNYWDTFIPIFYCTVHIDRNHTTAELMDMAHNPTIKNWKEFIPQFFLVPYFLVGRFASHFLEINYWTSRVVIMHAILMTLMEFTKIRSLFNGGIRKLLYQAIKYFCYVVLLSLCCKLLWPFVPFFIADCIFYWMLYVSPFDALNRLRRRFTHPEETQVMDRLQQHRQHHHHLHHGDLRRWQFDFEWNS